MKHDAIPRKHLSVRLSPRRCHPLQHVCSRAVCRSREFCRSRRLETRYAVHPANGVALPVGSRAGPSGRRCRKHKFKFPKQGTYRVWVRTIDWVARWDAKPSPGKFQILIDGESLAETFGTKGAQWSWHDGGTIQLEKGKRTIALHDLTGFDGRCDCIYLTTDLSDQPPPVDEVLSDWRREQLGLAKTPMVRGPYDLVVIGGGYAGMGAAISAARMGCRVALVQDRPVLGGNGSSEVRVWAMGNIRRGKFPRIGEIIEEFADKATKSPGTLRRIRRRAEGKARPCANPTSNCS